MLEEHVSRYLSSLCRTNAYGIGLDQPLHRDLQQSIVHCSLRYFYKTENLDVERSELNMDSDCVWVCM